MTLPPWTTSERRRIRVGEVTRFVRVSETRGRRTRSRRLPGLHMHRDVAACRIADGQASVGASALERNPADSATPLICAPMEREYERDRKSTRLNSSHPSISYAVF